MVVCLVRYHVEDCHCCIVVTCRLSVACKVGCREGFDRGLFSMDCELWLMMLKVLWGHTCKAP